MSRHGRVRDRLTRSGALRARGDLTAYLPLAVATTAASVAGRERAHLATKLLLAPTLSAGVLASRDRRPAGRTAALTVALVGSAVGDWFMNASGRTTTPAARRSLIRRGASAFAVQQAGLIGMQLRDGARPELRSAAVVSAVLAGLGAVDAVGTGEPDPVLTGYGLLLGSMSALALSEASTGRRRRSVAVGGGLFLLSDAAIIVGEHLAKTPRQQAVASGIVMSTYAAALALLVHGLRDSPTVPHT
ncbi:lysoplasmalogenase family protein [Knoellia subterranea]|uniref:YhhN family protein n=1 Tax=Knoellia subterranea KCTC 19937 TaxID=1385521 RepID=A0A0A0JQJ3_9MICO|nr:lysoplasmalogenase family protein [Knoellia subterranea]KGN37861.1 hypothetical protein N803_12435 [Knoellia subterranea KCTC 19937]